MCVCMYVCMYVCIYTYMYVCMYVYISSCIYLILGDNRTHFIMTIWGTLIFYENIQSEGIKDIYARFFTVVLQRQNVTLL